MADPASPLLSLSGLRIRYPSPGGSVAVVDGVDLEVGAGRIVGIAGESGSGKTQVLLALLGLLPASARCEGRLHFEGHALAAGDAGAMRGLRGRRMAMVFQDPMSALHPQIRIGEQLAEVMRCHEGASRAIAREAALRQLEAVGLDQPLRRARQYPHELSGGMRQRVVIAMALMCNPSLLLADEPTTALDVTVQAQVLDLLLALREARGMAMLLVTHDLGVMARMADELLVMERGRVVERGDVFSVFDRPAAPATQRLLAAAQALDLPEGAND
ncbi:MAG: Oligopeptide transport ATP-binding protein OppD [Pseudomonadota bacterium]